MKPKYKITCFIENETPTIKSITKFSEILNEDIEDIAAFEQRANEPDLDFDEVIKELKDKGKI